LAKSKKKKSSELGDLLSHEEAQSEFDKDSIRYGSFLITAAYALIAANWALLSSSVVNTENKVFIKWSLTSSIVFLAYQALLQKLNLSHWQKIFYDDNMEYRFGFCRTYYGKVQHFLYTFREIPILISFGLLLWGALN